MPTTASFHSFTKDGRGWTGVTFGRPAAVHVARSAGDVLRVLDEADRAASRDGWAVVVLAYEAAPAFDPAMPPRPTGDLPLAWVATFDRGEVRQEAGAPATALPGEPASSISWTPAWSRDAFRQAVHGVQAAIAAGDTYQVNLTFPLTAPFRGDTAGWYNRLGTLQQGGYCAHVDMGRHVVISASPELFFARRGRRITARPMKGTSRRGRWLAEDEALADELASSPKARAENVMIVDLLRNDLGRLAEIGSVHVPALFAVERYPTVWQMTSTIEARLPADPPLPLRQLMTALFPCGSVTGAPKIRTMQIIHRLEPEPRGVYTGSIGYMRPGGDCVFNVAIRTIVVDRETEQASLGVGAGITADSIADEEYDECLLKGAFAADPQPAPEEPFALLETLKVADGRWLLLEGHLARMAASARYFDFSWTHEAVTRAIAAAGLPRQGTWRVRLLAFPDGTVKVESAPLQPHTLPRRVALALHPVDDRDPFLCNKTTRRRTYEEALAARPEFDDVILWNRRGEITESTIANVVVELDGQRWTPPQACGLLGGTFRAELIEQGAIGERVIMREDLRAASRVWLINSVHGWMDAVVEGAG